MTPVRTPEGKWTLYAVATGQRIERWSVDAVPMLATGAYTTDPTLGASSPSVPVASGPEQDVPEPRPTPAAAVAPVRVETLPGGTPRRRRS